MTAEAALEETQKPEVVVSEQESRTIMEGEKKVEETTQNEDDDSKSKLVEENTQIEDDNSKPKMVEESSCYREDRYLLSDLKESERKALDELKSKLEEAILGNTLLKSGENKEKEKEKDKQKESDEKVEKLETEENPDKIKEEEAEEEEKEEIKNNGIEDISLWRVPLLPSKGSEGTDVILLKFLRAREFKVNEAFEMLKKTLAWRADSKIDAILEEDLGADLTNAAYMIGSDRENHPVCYNNFGVFGDEELYQKTFGSEEKTEQFLRWRFQFMEKGIKSLDFRPGGVTSILQVYDLKNCPGPSKKEIRSATYKVIELLQDNYPELLSRNVFINVPFWYYAFYSIISPFLTQRSKSKFVVAHPAKVTDTLLKYIPLAEIPTQYGGLKRENDFEFATENDGRVSELVKPGSTETIKIPAPETGTLIWDLAVLGWEVSYKEEFNPTDEGSYVIIIQKEKKMESIQEPIRNSFRNDEAGKVVLTIKNNSKKKKRAFYRYKNQKVASV